MAHAIALLALSILGVVDTLYLTSRHLYGAAACVDGSGCAEVLGSVYGFWFGVPVSAFGVGLYVAFTILSWRAIDRYTRDEAVRWISLLAIPACVVSVYLVSVQAFILGSWCPFCLASAALTVLILAISLRVRIQTHTLRPFIGALGSRHLIPPLVGLLLPPLAAGALPGAAASTTQTPESPVVARIGDRLITAAEIDRATRLDLYETRDQLRKEWLDRELLNTAAKEAGMDVRAYVREEVYRKIEVTQSDIDRRYEEIKHRLPEHVTKASVTRNIRNEIGNRKSKEALDAHIRALADRYGTAYEVPAVERFAFAPNPRQGPEKGPADAPVTIVEFSDLECGYCSRAHLHLGELMTHYEGKVRLIFKHLPLDMHTHARYAAEVAACAHEQGVFWPLADTLFATQDTFSETSILDTAKSLRLDPAALQACLDSGRGAAVVEADIAEADDLGISSTPTFFVNGHYVGSLPKDGLAPLIEQELRAVGAR